MTTSGDLGLLDPVWAEVPAAGSLDDRALVAAMFRVEGEWAAALADAGSVDRAAAEAVVEAARSVDDGDVRALVAAGPLGGNPVIALVSTLRARVAAASAPAGASSAVHRGLTSQDVLDSALQLAAAEAIDAALLPDLDLAGDAAATLAEAHRETLGIARTLGQPALPTTFGYRAATWLSGVQDARERLLDARSVLAVQLGGAVGTSASLVSSGLDVDVLRGLWAERLGLADPGRPWHTNRALVLQLGAALAGVIAAAGTIAADIATGSRPELGELGEGLAEGAGGSSAMPQKRNPVHSVMLRGAALQAPGLLATLATAAGTAVDERPDGAWHAEWPALRALLRLAGGAVHQLHIVLDGLHVDDEAMGRNLAAAGDGALAERVVSRFAAVAEGGRDALRDAIATAARAGDDVRAATRALLPETVDGVPADEALAEAFDPRGYLGQAPVLTDRAIERWRASRSS